MQDLRTQIITGDREFRDLESEWTALHHSAGGTVFQSFSWAHRWWEVYRRDGLGLRIITVRAEDRLVGVLPLYLDSGGIPGMRLRRLRMIGATAYGEYLPLLDREYSDPAVRALAESIAAVLRGPDCDLLSLYSFPPESGTMALLRSELTERGLASRYYPKVISRVTMNLPESWETYLSGLTSNERESIKRKTRALLKQNVEIEAISVPDDAAFGDYVRLHGESWEARGESGYFRSPEFAEFLRRVTMDMLSKGNARLYFLKANGNRFAAVHVFLVHEQCCFYLSGLDRNHEYVRFSPGKVLLAKSIQDAIGEGYTLFDFQGGAEGYKIRLGGTEGGFAKAVFWTGGLRGAKVRTLLFLQDILGMIRRRSGDGEPSS